MKCDTRLRKKLGKEKEDLFSFDVLHNKYFCDDKYCNSNYTKITNVSKNHL
jgi:hypothetical protein